MFNFIKKVDLWAALDSEYAKQLQGRHSFHLKTVQDLVVFNAIHKFENCVVAEIGGGESRILPLMAKKNKCYNIEKFEGADGGPRGDIEIPDVEIKHIFVGEFSPEIADNSIDVLFSVSVIEHIDDNLVSDFFLDCERILKPGGLMVHAIDMYLKNEPSDFMIDRFFRYHTALASNENLNATGYVNNGPPKFTCDMATNPDQIMYLWRDMSPSLNDLRQVAQSVSLLMIAKKSS